MKERKVELAVRDKAAAVEMNSPREGPQEDSDPRESVASTTVIRTRWRTLPKTGRSRLTAKHCKSKHFQEEFLKDIFSKIKNKNIESCPKVLEAALNMVLLSQNIPLEKVSVFHCISVNRLERNMMSLSKLNGRSSTSVLCKALTNIVCITDDEKFFEWMLRMRRMGRLPVMSDTHYVKEYLSLSYFPRGIREFIDVFGEKIVCFQNWFTITNDNIIKWEKNFKNFLTIHYEITAKKFMVRKNSSRIFSCVELYLSHTHFSNQVIILRGHRNMYSFVSPSQKGISVMVTFSAAGFYLKPLFLQQNYDLPVWTDQEFIDQSQFHIGATADGQLDPLLFVTWLKLFNAELLENKIEKPVLLFVHGHPCHASLAATTFCQEENIILFSHYHSPLNIMDPFLGMIDKFHFHYDRSLKIFQDYIGKEHLTLKHFPVIFLDALNKIREDHVMEAFKKSGLVPFDVSAVRESIDANRVHNSTSTLYPLYGAWVSHSPPITRKCDFEFAPQIQLPYRNQKPVVSEPHVIIIEPFVDKPFSFASNDPLQVSFEPLLQNSLDDNSVVHVYRNCVQDEQVITDTASNGINEKLIEKIEIKDEIDTVKSQDTVDGSSCSLLVAPPREGSATRWTARQSSCTFYDQPTSQGMLPGQSYESLGLYDVKIESCKIESPKSDDIEFPSVYIASDTHVDVSLSSKP